MSSVDGWLDRTISVASVSLMGRCGLAKTTVDSLLLSLSFFSFSAARADAVDSLFGEVDRGVSPKISETDFFRRAPDEILVARRDESAAGVAIGVCFEGLSLDIAAGVSTILFGRDSK